MVRIAGPDDDGNNGEALNTKSASVTIKKISLYKEDTDEVDRVVDMSFIDEVFGPQDFDFEEPYPSESCSFHPSRMWEWDGFGWVCPPCVVSPRSN